MRRVKSHKIRHWVNVKGDEQHNLVAEVLGIRCPISIRFWAGWRGTIVCLHRSESMRQKYCCAKALYPLSFPRYGKTSARQSILKRDCGA